jgi:hypothetical protein
VVSRHLLPHTLWSSGSALDSYCYKYSRLLFNRRINKRPFLGNVSVNTPTIIEKLLEAVFSVGSPRLYNEDPRSAEWIIERQLRVGSRELSCGIRLTRGGVTIS